MSKTPVGEIRPSQLLWTYGPGALIDLPNLSVVTMGIDRWEKDTCRPIQESRLLASVREALGPQVDSLRMPPIDEREVVDPFSAAAIGVPVKPFPRWLRCVKCGLLSPYNIGLFRLKENRYRPELTRFVHEGCRGWTGDQRARDADAVPARFLLACRAGHLDDFPWKWFVHGGPGGCDATMRFFESGASIQAGNVWVRCDGCGSSKSMAQAFGQPGRDNLPGCCGRHPHLNRLDGDCAEEPRAILLGATNGWFPVTHSVLAIPQAGSPLAQLVADGWIFFEDIVSASDLAAVVNTLRKTAQLPGIERFTEEQIWSAIENHRNGAEDVEANDLKGPEWDVLTSDESPSDFPHFMSKRVDVPSAFASSIECVLLLERLREVNALVGFTRVESPDEGAGESAAPCAPIGRSAPDWVPATQVYGEGIFLRFDTGALKNWSKREAVENLNDQLLKGHRGWRQRRYLDPDEGYPGIRYVMLHTLAHMLIRELALECGYSAASIRERIYADVQGGSDQAGLLIYTAAADSDGTLGGLVELGKPENLGRLMHQALERAKICASDPLCAEHDPTKDQSLHGAACHACSFVSETSCECGNRHLDRSLVVPTLENRAAAFFDDP